MEELEERWNTGGGEVDWSTSTLVDTQKGRRGGADGALVADNGVENWPKSTILAAKQRTRDKENLWTGGTQRANPDISCLTSSCRKQFRKKVEILLEFIHSSNKDQ